MSKIEEASRKKDEQTNLFISQTKEALEKKIENHTEKREAYISDLKTKLKVSPLNLCFDRILIGYFKDHIENVEKTRLSLEQQTDEVRSAIEDKLKTASAQRDENIKKMLERLKEHVSIFFDQFFQKILAQFILIVATFHVVTRREIIIYTNPA